MFRFPYGSKPSPKLNLSSPSSPRGICHPSPATFSRTCKSQNGIFGDNVENTTGHCFCSLGHVGSSPRQPQPPFHGGVLALPALDVTSPAGFSTLEVLVKVTVATSPCFSHAGDAREGTGRSQHRGSSAQASSGFINSLPTPAGCKVASLSEFAEGLQSAGRPPNMFGRVFFFAGTSGCRTPTFDIPRVPRDGRGNKV